MNMNRPGGSAGDIAHAPPDDLATPRNRFVAFRAAKAAPLASSSSTRYEPTNRRLPPPKLAHSETMTTVASNAFTILAPYELEYPFSFACRTVHGVHSDLGHTPHFATGSPGAVCRTDKHQLRLHPSMTLACRPSDVFSNLRLMNLRRLRGRSDMAASLIPIVASRYVPRVRGGIQGLG